MSTRNGYTLIELLAVVMVLGLVSAVVAPAFTRSASGDPIDHAVAALHAGDHRMRLHAIGSGGRTVLEAHGFTYAPAVDDKNDDPGIVVALDSDIEVTWTDDRQNSLREVTIDPRGRTRDLGVAIRARGSQRSFQIHGISGEWRLMDVRPSP
jgi:prepilin-type N-terminal cleavage/methylation domain-containing protein